jgi:hypothetical protein
MVSRTSLRLASFGTLLKSGSYHPLTWPHSIDGGGARSFSQLEVMRTIMHRLKWEKYPNEPDKVMLPSEHFDLIGGSETGGLVS